MRERKIQRLNAEGLWEYGIKTLSLRAHSIGELRQKLVRRAESSEDVESILARLKEHKYLDDRKYAEGFAAARLTNDNLGRGRVIGELRRRRVAPPLAASVVEKVYEGVDEGTLIDAWIRRKYRATPRECLFQEDKDLASAYRRLLHAGFRPGNIVKALKRFAKNPDLLDTFEPPEPSLEEDS